jgi:hypothetical protein
MKQCLQGWRDGRGAGGFVASNSDLLLFLVLAACGVLLITRRVRGMDIGASAALAGALFGGAALLLGNWINRYNDRVRAINDLKDLRSKLNTLIAAELVNVAAGLIDAKKFVDAAVAQLQTGTPLAGISIWVSICRVRRLSFKASEQICKHSMKQPSMRLRHCGRTCR